MAGRVLGECWATWRRGRTDCTANTAYTICRVQKSPDRGTLQGVFKVVDKLLILCILESRLLTSLTAIAQDQHLSYTMVYGPVFLTFSDPDPRGRDLQRFSSLDATALMS